MSEAMGISGDLMYEILAASTERSRIINGKLQEKSIKQLVELAAGLPESEGQQLGVPYAIMFMALLVSVMESTDEEMKVEVEVMARAAITMTLLIRDRMFPKEAHSWREKGESNVY